ncbi:shikimate dehydrogenase [Rhodococcus gannanensis]|uniref:Shikimate dehydrogenase (NADP(+)) n=1 Tax=Rhodococcus gannanensis TaxID=1960308 RepID=A0ABW4NY69_9NOCA
MTLVAHPAPSARIEAPTAPSFLCGLIGSGIARSLTPTLHEAEGRAQGVGYVYRILDIDSRGGVESLPRIINAAVEFGFDGLNVTHPCKQAVIPLLDDLSPDARMLGAVNTVKIDGDRLTGHNTDWTGFSRNLEIGLGDTPLGGVVQLGAGGAGVAVAYATMKRGAETFTVIDADPTRSAALADRLRSQFPGRTVASGGLTDVPDAVRSANGLVHATPIGMAAHPGIALDPELLRPDLWVADVVYRPTETELLRRARALGARTVSGIGMTVGQAVDSFRIFTGREADEARMSAHMKQILAAE